MNTSKMRIIVTAAAILTAIYVLFMAVLIVRSTLNTTTEAGSTEANIQEATLVEPATSIELGKSTSSANAVTNARSIDTIYAEAKTALQNNEWAQAITNLERVQSLDDAYELEDVHNALVTSYLNAGKAKISDSDGGPNRFEMALSLYRKATTLAPDNEQILREIERLNTYLLAERAIRLGSPQQAIDILQPLYTNTPPYMAAQVGQRLYDVYLEIGDRAMRKGNTQVAVDYFGRAQGIGVADSSKLEARLQSLEQVRLSLAPVAPAATATPPPPPTAVATATVAPAQPLAPTATSTFIPTTVPTAIPTRVFVARATATATATFTPPPTAVPVVYTAVPATPLPTAAPRLRAASCPDPRSVISSPLEGETVSGYVAIMGTAVQKEFKYYKVEIAPKLSAKFSFISSEEIVVENGNLSDWNSGLVADGEYKLRVTVVQPDGNYPPPCDVNIIVQNNPSSE